MNKNYPNTKEIQIAIIAIVGMMTIITGFSYQFDAEKERLESQKIRAQKIKDWEDAVYPILLSNCKLTDDASDLFRETFKSTSISPLRIPGSVTLSKNLDVQLWECRNGVRYWTRRGKLPDGFIEHYANDLPKKP